MLNVDITTDKIRVGTRFALSLQRTLRIPDDGQTYPLPPGLGAFPIRCVEDFAARVPPLWARLGGAFIPMYQREALWIFFHAASWKPNAVKVAIGGVNAISGESNDAGLKGNPQNYMVCPNQPWLDGINSARGSVRQFVAMPLGLGYTVEESVAGREALGGIQITVFEPKAGRFPDRPPANVAGLRSQMLRKASIAPMGLGAGGSIRQRIYPDPYGLDVWDLENHQRVCIHIANSLQFEKITGTAPPPTPIDASTYNESGLPWFDLYDEHRGDLAPAVPLVHAQTIAERDSQAGQFQNDVSFDVPDSRIKKLGGAGQATKTDRSSSTSAERVVRRSE